MKKRLALLSIVGILLLSSCQKKTDTTKRSDNPSSSNITALKLDSVKQGTLVKEISTESDYVTVKIAEDYKDTLFYVSTSLTDTLKEHGTLTKSLTIKPLTFTEDITDAERGALAGYVYSETGLYSKDFGFDVSKDFTAWDNVINIKEVAEAYDKEASNYTISVIYVPAYVSHYATSYTALECYVMFPLYYQIYKDGSKEEVFDSKAIDLTSTLEFENNNLKSQTTEVSA